GEASSEAGTMVVSSVLLFTWVGRTAVGAPSETQRTRVPGWCPAEKPVPVTVNVRSGPPATTLGGDSELMQRPEHAGGVFCGVVPGRPPPTWRPPWPHAIQTSDTASMARCRFVKRVR